MEIMVTGERISCKEGINLERLVQDLGYQKNRIACEVNGEIIVKDEYENCTLGPADTLEVVTFVGGG